MTITQHSSYMLKEHLFNINGKIENHGIKFFSNSMLPDLNELYKKEYVGNAQKIKNYWCDCHVAEHFAKNDATLVRKPSHSPAQIIAKFLNKARRNVTVQRTVQEKSIIIV